MMEMRPRESGAAVRRVVVDLLPVLGSRVALPAAPWIMAQTWRNLLFAHWPVAPERLRPLVPAGLTLDTFDGVAWVGVVAFRLSGVRFRGTPPLPGVSAFPEINVRTYVTCGGAPGVLFLSLDANNPPGIAVARPLFRLPYSYSRIAFAESAEGIRFQSRRPGGSRLPAAFDATYRPAGPIMRARPGALAAWLTERYGYYTAGPDGALYHCAIQHAAWALQPAAAVIHENTMLAAHGLPLEGRPLLHYAHFMRARFWPLRRLRSAPAPATFVAAPQG
jgi:uncharacterized protein